MEDSRISFTASIQQSNCADREEHKGRNGAVDADDVQELPGEDGEAGHTGHADEQVRPDQRPSGQNPTDWAEAAPGVGVHRAGGGGSAGELVEIEHHEKQHRGAEQVGEPGSLSGIGERQWNDEDRGHRG